MRKGNAQIRPRSRLPWLVYVLAAGTFPTGTTEYVVAGFLPNIASGLHVSDGFWSGTGASSRATGVLIFGLILANVVGVPVGTRTGQLAGWRGSLWALTALALAAAAVTRRILPSTDSRSHSASSVRAELAAVRNRSLWPALSAGARDIGEVPATYPFTSPLLTVNCGAIASRLERV